MEENQKTDETRFENATAVTILVHGVGDAKSTDILSETRRAIASANAERVRIVHAEAPWYMGFPKYLGPFEADLREALPALEIDSDTERHIVLPLVWSRTRRRAARQGIVIRRPMADPLYPLSAGTLGLFAICGNIFRCIRQAKGVFVKTSFVLLGVTVSLLTLAMIPVASYSVSYLLYWLESKAFIVRYLSEGFIFFLVFWLARRVLKKVFALFDFCGDVVSYVGDRALREQLLDHMDRTIAGVAQMAPQAQIIIVGHSLGSVLVSQSLANLAPKETYAGRVILITLGSPLRLLSRLFPRVVRSPQELSQDYAKKGTVSFWANLWRDWDLIGSSLRVEPSATFGEDCLGLGSHTNYWGDAMLWRTTELLMKEAKAGSLAKLSERWSSIALTDEDWEGLDRLRYYIIQTFSTYLFYTALGLASTSPIIFNRTLSRFSFEDVKTATFFLSAWKIYLVAFPITFIVMYFCLMSFRCTERKQLNRVRRMGTLYVSALTNWLEFFWFFNLMVLSCVCAGLIRMYFQV